MHDSAYVAAKKEVTESRETFNHGKVPVAGRPVAVSHGNGHSGNLTETETGDVLEKFKFGTIQSIFNESAHCDMRPHRIHCNALVLTSSSYCLHQTNELFIRAAHEIDFGGKTKATAELNDARNPTHFLQGIADSLNQAPKNPLLDPIFRVEKESGTIVAKTERCMHVLGAINYRRHNLCNAPRNIFYRRSGLRWMLERHRETTPMFSPL